MRATIRIARTVGAAALVAFVAGAFHAAREIWPRTWVLEFQAGHASSVGERLVAINQSAALEAVGFGLIGLVLALLATALVRILPRWKAEDTGSGFGAALVLCATAFFGWTSLSWMAEEALAFLTRRQVVLLDLVAVAAFLAALLVFDALVRRLSWAPRAGEPTAIASAAACVVATALALRIVQSGNGADPTLMAMAGTVYLLLWPVAAFVARLIDRPVALLRGRMERGPLLGRKPLLALWALVVVSVIAAIPSVQLSPIGGPPSYATLPDRGPVDGPNVVYVTVDTLRADHLSCYGYPRPTSPFLDSLAKEGTRCADVSAAASWTKPATGTLFTGLYPSRHGALYHGSSLHLPEGMQTVAEAFRNANYVTAGFVANPNLKKVFAFDRGFDEYFDSPVEDTLTLACIRGTHFGHLLMKLLRHQFNWNYENDFSQMNREVLAWLEKNHERRFFLYAHYIDPHIPYDPPERYRREFAQDHGFVTFNERKRLVGIDLYDGEIRYTDDGLKELVDALKRHGVWENTLLVFTSDHGEEFFEHGVIGHGFSLYQEVVHVPLVLRGPGVPAGQVLQEPVQAVDVAATVLSLAGLDHASFGDGHSFHDRIQGTGAIASAPLYLESEFGVDDSDHREFVFSGVRQGQWKLVLTQKNQWFPPDDPRGSQAFYDLGADPDERRNLIKDTSQRERIQAMLAGLTKHASFLQEKGFRDIAPAALTPEVEANLRALGYIGGGQ